MYLNKSTGKLPSQYYSTSNTGYKEFLMDFTKSIKTYNEQITNIQNSYKASMQEDKHRLNMSMLNALSGHPRSFSSSISLVQVQQNEVIRKNLEQKVRILERAVTLSNETNYKEKAKAALEEIEALDNPTVALNNKYRY